LVQNMAKLPNGARAKLTLSTGDAYVTLREPTNEEMNEYQASKFNGPDKATPAEAMMHLKRVMGEFFDKLVTGFEDLEDSEGQPVTVERKDEFPLHLKAEIIFQRFDRTPVEIDEKN
jgi:hypothetical protein